MTDAQSSFWTPARIAVVIGAVLLVVALAYLVSLPQNNYHPCDLLEPTNAGDAELGFWMVDEYDPEVDVYHLLVVMEHDDGTFEWLDGDGIWLPRRAVDHEHLLPGLRLRDADLCRQRLVYVTF